MRQHKAAVTVQDIEEHEALITADLVKPEQSSEFPLRWNGNNQHRRDKLPWIISTIVLAVLLTLSLVNQFLLEANPSACLSSENAVDLTDLPDARQAIVYERQRYSGSLDWDYSKNEAYRVLDGDVQYFGSPSKELDDNWKTLLENEFPFLYEDEKPDSIAEENRLWDGFFHFEPDFFHNLHCLNEVRRRIGLVLYPDVSYGKPSEEDEQRDVTLLGPNWTRHHIEHCMDRIRQDIMCHGDLTPSIMHRWNGSIFALGQTGERRCRKFEPIRKWMDDRTRRDNQTLEAQQATEASST